MAEAMLGWPETPGHPAIDTIQANSSGANLATGLFLGIGTQPPALSLLQTSRERSTMIRLFRALLVFMAVAATAAPAAADEFATADEAVALVKKAVAFYEEQGQDKAFAAFKADDGGFQVKDLYIFAQDLTGMTLVHKNPGLIGKAAAGYKDAEGKLFMAEMIKVANEKGSGWVDYMWVNPATKKIQAKSTYVERVGDVFLGAGIYK